MPFKIIDKITHIKQQMLMDIYMCIYIIYTHILYMIIYNIYVHVYDMYYCSILICIYVYMYTNTQMMNVSIFFEIL